MGEIEDAIERADQEAFTRQPPKSIQARVNYLMRQLGSARAVAIELGVTPGSVSRYRRGTRRHPPPAIAARIDRAVRARWQPRIRARRHRQAATTTGITIETRARFGYTAPVGTTDDGRIRRLTVHLPAPYARRLFDARAQGDEQQMRAAIADGLRDVYFQDNGTRALGLTDVTLTDIDYLDVKF